MSQRTSLNLDNRLNDAQLTDFKQLVRDAQLLIDRFVISLNDDERRSARSVSEGREGMVREVVRIANEYEEVLPRNLDLNRLVLLEQQFASWRGLLVLVEKLAEKVDDTSLALSIELMHLTDIVQNALQLARKYNANLDRVLQGIDDYNSRFGKRSSTTPPATDEQPPITPFNDVDL